MSTVTRARKSFRLVVISVIMSAMLAVSAPAQAQVSITDLIKVEDKSDIAVATGGRGGNGGIALALGPILNCIGVIAIVACGPLGGGAEANGGDGAPALAFTLPDELPGP